MSMVTEVTLFAVAADGIPRHEIVHYPDGYDSERIVQDADDPSTLLGQAQNRLDVFLTETLVPAGSPLRVLYEDFNSPPSQITDGKASVYCNPRNTKHGRRHSFFPAVIE